MKMTSTLEGNSATGKKELTARQWARLIEFSGVENRKRVKNLEAKSNILVMQRMCASKW